MGVHYAKRFVGLIVAFLVSVLANSAAAQSMVWQQDSVLRNVLMRAGVEHRGVRMTSHLSGRVEGERVSLRADSVIVVGDNGNRAVALADIDSLWVQRGTAAFAVGIVAAIPCAIFGGLVGSFIGGDPDSNGSPNRGTVMGLLGFALGGLVCGGVGAEIGSMFERWPLAYARPAPTIN